MNLRLILIGLLLAFSSVISFAQEANTNIKTDFTNYTDALVEKDFEGAVEYMIPEFFSIVSKDQLIQLMETIYSNPEIEFEMTEAEILSINEIEIIEERYYSILSYATTIEMKFNLKESDDEPETEEEQAMETAMIKANLEQTFGKENVSYNDETEFFSIYSVKPVCAMSMNGQDNWKFVVVEEEQKAILGMFLPQALMDKI